MIAAHLRITGTPGYFVVAGDRYTDADLSEDVPVVSPEGYDGQFFYRLSLDPFSSRGTVQGVTFDAPSYRHQRIGYPLIVWLVSFGGSKALVPWTMLAVNLAAVIGLTAISAGIARRLGMHPLWGAIAGFYPGFVTSITRDTAEAVAACLLLAGILLHMKSADRWAATALSLAVITRETTLLVPLALVIMLTWRKELRRAVIYLAPSAAFIVLQGLLWWAWGKPPLVAGSGQVASPFSGILDALPDRAAIGITASVIWWAQSLMLVLVILLVMLRTFRADGEVWSKLAFAGHFLLVISLGAAVWIEGHGFLRASTELFVLGALLLLPAGILPRSLVAAATTAVWAISAYSSLPG